MGRGDTTGPATARHGVTTAACGSVRGMPAFAGSVSKIVYPASKLAVPPGPLAGMFLPRKESIIFPACLPALATRVKPLVYTFRGGQDGTYPLAALINGAGILYGKTINIGGTKNCTQVCGTVFKFLP